MESLLIEKIKDVDMLIVKKINSYEKKPDKINNFTQVRILFYLFNNRDIPVYQKNLGEALKLKKSSITEQLNYLEKEQFIKRIEDRSDKRKKQICCTRKTINQITKIENNFRNVNEEVVSGITNDELNALTNILDKIERKLKG